MKGLEGKVALVTGGGDAVGRSIALALAARGVRVVVTGSDERALGETVGEIAYGGGKARHVAGDVTRPADVEAAAARAVEVFGGLDIVVAGAKEVEGVELGCEPDRAGALFATNLLAAYHAFGAAASRMRGPGRLVATSCAPLGTPEQSRGSTRSAAGPAFAASNAGLVGLVRATALELSPRKITCNAVVAGCVETEVSEKRLTAIAAAQGTTKDEVRAAAIAGSPLGRLLQPEEIAELVVFLCSPSADAITGKAIAIGANATVLGI